MKKKLPAVPSVPRKASPVEKPSPTQLQVKAYEEAVQLFGARKYRDAKAAFEKVAGGPDAPVADKARTYAQVCARRMDSAEPKLRTAEEHFNYGVGRLNERDFEAATHHLKKASELAPAGDHIFYTMALCRGLAGDAEGACENLKRAIDLEPKNRILARQDPEFLAVIGRSAAIRGVLESGRG